MHKGFTYGNPYRYGYSLPKSNAMPQKWAEDIECVHPSSHPQKGAIYVSNVEAASNHNTLAKYNIKAVMTCAKGHDHNIPKSKLDMFEYFPFDDKETCNITPYFQRACDFITKALQRTNVLVHCIAGVSRSVSMVLAYMIREKGMSYEEAYRTVKSRRKIISPNQGFIRQLKDYANKIKDQMKSPKINARAPQKSQIQLAQRQRYYNTLVHKNPSQQQKQRLSYENQENQQNNKYRANQIRSITPEAKRRVYGLGQTSNTYSKSRQQSAMNNKQSYMNKSTILTKSPTMMDSHIYSTPQKNKVSYSTQDSIHQGSLYNNNSRLNNTQNNNGQKYNNGRSYSKQSYDREIYTAGGYNNRTHINDRRTDYYKQMSKQLNDNINAIHAKYQKQREELLNRRNYKNDYKNIINQSTELSDKFEKYKDMGNFTMKTAKYSKLWEDKYQRSIRYSQMNRETNYTYYRSPCF